MNQSLQTAYILNYIQRMALGMGTYFLKVYQITYRKENELFQRVKLSQNLLPIISTTRILYLNMSLFNEKTLLFLLRISMSFIFLWAFFDKLFGLGIGTKPANAWIQGFSPTSGFLKLGTRGYFKPFFESLAGNMAVDWLFMLGLLFLGISLLFGIGMTIAGYAGTILMILLWLSLFPPQSNPILDQHIIYVFVLLLLRAKQAGRIYGLGNWWKDTRLVKKYQWLE